MNNNPYLDQYLSELDAAIDLLLRHVLYALDTSDEDRDTLQRKLDQLYRARSSYHDADIEQRSRKGSTTWDAR